LLLFFVKYKKGYPMDNPSKNQASGSDDRFLGESMLRRIANFGIDRNPNQTKHWMPDSAGNKKINFIIPIFS
jgi:hypothetical protein